MVWIDLRFKISSFPEIVLEIVINIQYLNIFNFTEKAFLHRQLMGLFDGQLSQYTLFYAQL